MGSFNFMAQYAPLVESGIKPLTIRAGRRDGRDPQYGDKLHLFTGQRTRKCRKLAVPNIPAPTVKMRGKVVFTPNTVTVAGVDLSNYRLGLARLDGFQTVADMLAFHLGKADSVEKILYCWALDFPALVNQIKRANDSAQWAHMQKLGGAAWAK